MSRSKHTEAAIIAALKEVEAGRKIEDVAREQGVFKHTVYAWKAKYGGMDVSEAEEIKHLRDENSRLKKFGCRSEPGQRYAAVSHKKKTPLARSTKGRSEALAGGVSGQRAPRLRADGVAEDDLLLSELPG